MAKIKKKKMGYILTPMSIEDMVEMIIKRPKNEWEGAIEKLSIRKEEVRKIIYGKN